MPFSSAMTVSSTAATPLIRNSGSTKSTTTGSSSAVDTSKGLLQAAILSTYDLELHDPPSYVEVSVGETAVKTGPPAQRHKDRNSFKFSGATGQVQIAAPLQDLYSSVATIRVVYKTHPAYNMTATYALKQLKIHETTWLILQLDSDYAEHKGDDDDVPPTLRLQLTLSGPYRPEIGIFVSAFETWFRAVDNMEGYIQDNILSKLPSSNIDPKYFLIPIAPLAAILVVSAPVLIGIMTVTLPVALPVLVVLGVVLAVLAGMLGLVYSSTKSGRSQIGGALSPVSHTFLSTAAGQTLVYNTGPRPTPVKVARNLLPEHIWGRLIVSLLIDLVGSSSYLLPGVGEFVDIAWAPIQTVLIMAMYDATSPNLKYVSFIEEILPFTDIVPSATIGWMAEFGVPMILGGQNNKQQESSSSTTTRNSAATPAKDLLVVMKNNKNLIVPTSTTGSTASTPVAQN